MLPTNRVPTHPGEVLMKEFLIPLGLTQVGFAAHLKIPIQRVNEIVKGRRGVTPETALLFAAALQTSPELWTNLQASHDLALAQARAGGMPSPLAPAGNMVRDLVAAAGGRRPTGIHKKK